MSTVKVLAGSLIQGQWTFTGMFGSCLMLNGKQTFDFKTGCASVELLNEEKVKKLAGTAGWGLAGAALLGPIGAIGGMLLGGNKKEVAFVCRMKNGGKFMATTDGKTWQKIMAATF